MKPKNKPVERISTSEDSAQVINIVRLVDFDNLVSYFFFFCLFLLLLGLLFVYNSRPLYVCNLLFILFVALSGRCYLVRLLHLFYVISNSFPTHHPLSLIVNSQDVNHTSLSCICRKAFSKTFDGFICIVVKYMVIDRENFRKVVMIFELSQ